jgi:RNA polymerase sigma-70 factor (ECF subfamily)
MDDQARLAVVLEALGTLPEGERAALLLRVDHDLPYEDIAAALGTTVGAAKVRVHRARLRLAQALEHDESERKGA